MASTYGADRDWQVIDITPTAAGGAAKAAGASPGYSNGLTSQEAERLLQVIGRNELPSKTTPKWLVFLQQLYGPMPIMIWMAIVIEVAIGNFLDMGILLVIQFANAIIGWYEMTKAGDAVAALKATLKPVATVKRDGRWQNMDATFLVPGDLVLLRSGNSVPADCFVNDGQVEVDQSALTGESMPVTRYTGESVMMGSTVARGEIEATVQHTGKNTSFGKTATMLSGVRNIGNLNRILLKIMLVLVSLSVTLCSISLAVMLAEGQKVKDALEYVVVLLVASIPVAIEIVCTTTLALGSKELSTKGAIVTRLAAIEEMAGMNVLCSDKTGTLTQNKMVIQDDFPIFESGETWQSVLMHAALATRWREPPRDALDTLVLGASDLDALSAYNQVNYTPFDSSIKRTEATVQLVPGGQPFSVTKGAPDVVLQLVHNVDKVRGEVMAKVDDLAARGIRGLAVARTDTQGRWVLLGIITFLDPPRADTKETIASALDYGVDVKMVTGDHVAVARETARVLGMGMNIKGPEGLPVVGVDGYLPPGLGKQYGPMVLQADGFAQVLPEHKFVIVEALRQGGFAVGMTGDGVNDTPALKRADVGIAVEGSTDAAIAASDIVLTRPGLSVIIDALFISRCIFQRAKSFITYRIAATLQLLVFFFIASMALRPTHFCDPKERVGCSKFRDFFELPVVMLMLITLLNDGTLISIAYDRATPSERPEKWNLPVVFLVSTTLGMVACLSSVILLWAALDAHRLDAEKNLLRLLGLPKLDYDIIVTMMYLKVSISDFLTLFSCRTQSFVLTSALPSPILLGSAIVSLLFSTVIACVWPNDIKWLDLSVPALGLFFGPSKTLFLWVWAYCLVWWVIQDLCKVLVNWLVLRFDLFGARTGKLVNMREVTTLEDDQDGLALEVAGKVEGKVLGLKARQALAKTNDLPSKAPILARVSDDLRRISDSMDRVAHEGLVGTLASPSAQPRGPHDVEHGAQAPNLDQLLDELAADTQKLPRGTQDQLKGDLIGVQEAGHNLSQVAQVVGAAAAQRRQQGDLLGSLDTI